MKPENIPDDADEKTRQTLERIPDYCPECGEAFIIYGGRLDPEMGFYEHIDPMITCENGCKQRRFTMGTTDGGAEGREMRHIAGDWSATKLGDVAGYCDLHSREMKATKDLILNVDGEKRKLRQFKCPECDLETVVTLKSEH